MKEAGVKLSITWMVRNHCEQLTNVLEGLAGRPQRSFGFVTGQWKR